VAPKEEELWGGACQTLYVVEIDLLPEPFPMTELVKLNGDEPLSADYGYSTASYAGTHRSGRPAFTALGFGGSPDLGPVWIGHVPVTSVLRTLQDCAALPLAPELLAQALREAEQRGLARRAALDRIAAGHAKTSRRRYASEL
jgi:hypothetical protein